MKTFSKIILASILVTLIMPASVARAGLASGSVIIVGTDVPQTLKEYVADTIVNALVNAAVGTITSSVTKWANNGFEGKPAFSQNFAQELKKNSGDVIEAVLNELTIHDVNLGGFICGPFSQEIKDVLRVQLAVQRGSEFKHSKCTVEHILQETGYTLQQFEDDFTKGSWPAWLEVTTNPVNNRYGAYFNLQAEIARRQSEVAKDREDQLSYGSGYLSKAFKGPCLDTPEERARYQNPPADFVGPQPQPDSEGCYKRGPKQIGLPGATIQTHVAKALGLPEDRLAIADEVDEMIGALAQGLVTKVFSGVKGLVGAGESGPGGEESALAQLLREGQSEKERLNRKAQDAADATVERSSAIARIGQQISEKRDKLNICLAELAALRRTVVNVDVDVDSGTGDSSSDTTVDDDDIAAKQAECDAIEAEIRDAEDDMADQTQSQADQAASYSAGGGGNPYTCLDDFDAKPASRPVDYFNAGPIQGSIREIDDEILRISGFEPKRFYKDLSVSFDVSMPSPIPGDHIFGVKTDRQDSPNHAYGFYGTRIDKRDYRGTFLAADMFLGDNQYFKEKPTDWSSGKNFHIETKLEAVNNTFSMKIVETNTGEVRGDFVMSDARRAPDIALVSDLFVNPHGETTWRFTNIRVHLTPGGPYHGGIPAKSCN